MSSRQNDTVTRVDVRIPNHLYRQIQEIATEHFNARIHHRSQKPEVTPTILELIQIGIEHFTVSLPVEDSFNSNVAAERIEQIELRLNRLERHLLNEVESEPEVRIDIPKSKGLSDAMLAKLLGMSDALIAQYRHYGEANAVVRKRLKDWQVVDNLWVKKEKNS